MVKSSIVACCPFCGNLKTIAVSKEDLQRYGNGVPVKEAFVDMDAEDRALLETGICSHCRELISKKSAK